MNTEYRQAVKLWVALNGVLDAMPIWEIGSPELTAREDLAYWIACYRMGKGTYLEWLLVTQQALDVLIGNTPGEMAA